MKVDSTLYFAFAHFHPHQFCCRGRVAQHTCVSTLLAFANLGLTPIALMEKMFAPAGSLFEQNNKLGKH